MFVQRNIKVSLLISLVPSKIRNHFTDCDETFRKIYVLAGDGSYGICNKIVHQLGRLWPKHFNMQCRTDFVYPNYVILFNNNNNNNTLLSWKKEIKIKLTNYHQQCIISINIKTNFFPISFLLKSCRLSFLVDFFETLSHFCELYWPCF